MRTPTVVVTALAPACGALCPAAADDPTARVLLAGDSVTQGSSGDWTWRYRLWKHLEASGSPVDFVGPRNDLFELHGGAQDYVDPAFDTDHAASWGTTFIAPKYPVADLVRDYRPDVVVSYFGINDLAGPWRTPQDVVDSAAQFVAQARSSDPEVDVVLVAIPQTWIPGVTDYNAALPGLVRALDTPGSRVVVTPLAAVEAYVDTYDATHLAATGEVRVAAVVADALAVLGIAPAFPRPLPVVPNGPRAAGVLSLQSSGDTVADLLWINPPGAWGQYVWMRDVSVQGPWMRVAGPVAHTSYRVEGLVRGPDYEFRLQATKGTAVSEDMFSNVVAVNRPAPAITAVRVRSRHRVLRLRWWSDPPSAGDVRYTVAWWPEGHHAKRRVRRVALTRFVIERLRPGRVYRLTVKAWKSGTPGPGSTTVGITLPRLISRTRGPSVR